MLAGESSEDQVKMKPIKMNYDILNCGFSICCLIVTPTDSCVERFCSSSIVMLRDAGGFYWVGSSDRSLGHERDYFRKGFKVSLMGS